MIISYCGQEEVIISATKYVDTRLKNEFSFSVWNQDGTEIEIQELVIGENLPDFPVSFTFGEWGVSISKNKALIGGQGVSAVLNALEHFESLANPGKPIPFDYFYHCKKTYPVKKITLDGVDIASYKIVYEKGKNTVKSGAYETLYRYTAQKQAAEDLCLHIAERYGIAPRQYFWKENLDLSRCIVIGVVPSHPAKTKRYGDCEVYVENTTVYVDAGDICGMESGVSFLSHILTKEENNALSFADLSYHSFLQNRSEYENNSSAFLPCYRTRYALSPEELSFDKKAEKLDHPEEGLFLLAHRGEHTYYPENSLEANISAYFCGADSTELDIGRTQDGVLVCIHDESLIRTTNVSDFLGREGFPNSPLVKDWTLEQLRNLRLLDSYGTVSDFLIPTLEEILIACNDKIFVHIDKKFDYETEVFPIMEKHGLYRCLYLCNYIEWEDVFRIRDHFKDKGIRLQSVYRFRKPKATSLIPFAEELLNETDLTPAIVYLNDYCNNQCNRKTVVHHYKGRMRIASWMMWDTDYEYYWREATEVGFNFLMTNFPMRLRHEIG